MWPPTGYARRPGEGGGSVLCHPGGPGGVRDGGRRPAAAARHGLVTHLTGQLELFWFGAFAERLAERFTVIGYDKPGCGLSDTDGADLSFDGQVAAATRHGTRSGWRHWRLPRSRRG